MQRLCFLRFCQGGRTSRLAVASLTLAAVVGSLIAWAAETVTVVQRDRTFSVKRLALAQGGTINFTNEDDFPHQVHVSGPGMNVDSNLQEEGETVLVQFPNAGLFKVRCGIHPRMQLTVQVK